jgi:HrpA-like RNA helicase
MLSVPEGDHLTLLNVFNEYQNSTLYSPLLNLADNISLVDLHDHTWAWHNYVSARSLSQADNVRAQLLRVMERLEVDVLTKEYGDQTRHYANIRRALVSGYFMQVAHKKGEKGSYLTVKDNQVRCSFLPSLRDAILFYLFSVHRWYRYTPRAVSTRDPNGSSLTNSCSRRDHTYAR